MPRRVCLRTCKGGQRAQCRSMMHYNELVPAQASAPVPHAERLRLAVAAYLARFKGTSRDHTNSDLRCYLAWCTERGLDPFPGPAPASGVVHPVVAAGPPVQALNGLTALLRHGRVLPDLRHRRRTGALTGRVRPPPGRAGRVTDSRVHAPAIRGHAHHHPPVRQPERLRLGGHARGCWACGSSRPPVRTSAIWARSTGTGPASLREGRQGRPGEAAPNGRQARSPTSRALICRVPDREGAVIG